jgi:hypothetical protein
MKLWLLLTLITLIKCESYTDTCTNTENCLEGLIIQSNFSSTGNNASYTLINPSTSCNVTVIIMALPDCLSITGKSSSVVSLSIASAISASLFNDTCVDSDPFFDCWYQNDTVIGGECYSSFNMTYYSEITTYRIELYPNTTTFYLSFDQSTNITLKPALLTADGADPCLNCSIRQPYECTSSIPGSFPSTPYAYDLVTTCDLSPSCIGGMKLTAVVYTNQIVYSIVRVRTCLSNTFYIPLPTELSILSTACVSSYQELVIESDNPCTQNTILFYSGYRTYEFVVNGQCDFFTINVIGLIDNTQIVYLPLPMDGYDAVLGTVYCGSNCVLPTVYSNFNASYESVCGVGSGCIASAPITAYFFTDNIEYTIGHSCSGTAGLYVDFWIPIPTENTIRTSSCVLGYGEVTVSTCSAPITLSGYRTYKVVLNSTCTTFKLYLNGYFDVSSGTYATLPMGYRITLGEVYSSFCSTCNVPILGKYVQRYTTGLITTGETTLTTATPVTTNGLTTSRVTASTTGPLTTGQHVTTSPLTTGIFDMYTYTSSGCMYNGTELSCIQNGSLSSADFYSNKIIYYYSHTCTHANYYIPLPIGVGISSTNCVFAYGSAPQTFGTSCSIDGRYTGYVLWGIGTEPGCNSNFTLFLNTTIDRLSVQRLPEPALGYEEGSFGSVSLCHFCEVAVPRASGFAYTTGALTSGPLTTSPLTTGGITTGQRDFFFSSAGQCLDISTCIGDTIIGARSYASSLEYFWDPINCNEIRFRVPIPSNLTIISLDCAVSSVIDPPVGYVCENGTQAGYTVYVFDVEFACSSFTINFADVGYDYSRLVLLKTGVFTHDSLVGPACTTCYIPTLNFFDLSFTTGGMTTGEVTSGKATTGSHVTTGEFTSGLLFEDCNNNGVPDVWEISMRGVSDINNNGIPDECEGLENTHFLTETFITIMVLVIAFAILLVFLYYSVFPFCRSLLRRVDGGITERPRTQNTHLDERGLVKRRAKYSSDSESDEEELFVRKKSNKTK